MECEVKRKFDCLMRSKGLFATFKKRRQNKVRKGVEREER
jgi:hypothetical protein